ncbi:helix-turn-helix domain-containing protein (plasmid) [Enterobacter mori]|uniref:helix-turn-helix domain-containing protein n=1 Tax=Enterobacter mori TaxID=539813 RepID=UPI0032AFB12D
MSSSSGASERSISRFKPGNHIENIIRHLLPVSVIKRYPVNRTIYFDNNGERLALLLLEGQVDVSRTENGLLKGTVRAPFIFGLSHPEYVGIAYGVMTVTPVSVAVLPYREAMQVIREQALWEDFSQFLQYIIGLHYSLGYATAKLTSRDVILRCLSDLMNETEEYRLKTNACRYIMEKTALSRSGIMHILGRLKSTRQIETERGVLLSVSADLSRG